MAKGNQSKKRSKKNKKIQILIAFFVVLFIMISYGLDKVGVWDAINTAINDGQPKNQVSAEDGVILSASFIDIGQGDCSLFISNGETMLIDCGESEYADTVIETLRSMGITQLDYAVATHAHTDHMGGMAEIITTVPTANLIMSEPSDKSAGTASYEKFLDAAETSKANVILAEPTYTFSLGYAQCKILTPLEVSQTEENNNSVVMSITAGETSFLLTGDAEKTVENQILAEYPTLKIDILKVGHHGSKTSSSEKFIKQIAPETAIISVGKNNRYGHPAEDTLKTLSSTQVYRTDLYGTISVTCTADTYSITTEK